MEVKDILKNRRIDLGLTLKEVADKVGVSEATVSRWESGDIANMRRDRIAALASVLDVSPGGNKRIVTRCAIVCQNPRKDATFDEKRDNLRELCCIF